MHNAYCVLLLASIQITDRWTDRQTDRHRIQKQSTRRAIPTDEKLLQTRVVALRAGRVPYTAGVTGFRILQKPDIETEGRRRQEEPISLTKRSSESG